jgi:hypothetical protein
MEIICRVNCLPPCSTRDLVPKFDPLLGEGPSAVFDFLRQRVVVPIQQEAAEAVQRRPSKITNSREIESARGR